MDYSLAEEILKILKSREDPLNTFILKKELQEQFCDLGDFDDTLRDLLLSNKVEYTSWGLKIKYNDLKILIENSDDIVKKYFSGNSIKKLSKDNGKSHVLIESQIISSIEDAEVNDMHVIDFQKYKMTLNQFTILYETDKEIFRYLQLKYIPGKTNIFEVVNDPDKTISFKERFNALVGENVESDGKIVELTSVCILSHILERHNSPITEIGLLDKYDQFLKDNGLTELKYLIIGKNNLDSLYNKDNNILYVGDSELKYYPFSRKEVLTFFEQLNLSEYDDMYIHVRLIIKRNKELMESYGIENEFQLYFLLWKYKFYLRTYKIKFIKAPAMAFGKLDIHKQIEDLLEELGKISIKEFYQIFEERFGVPGESLRPSYMWKYKKYMVDSEYFNYNIPKLNVEQLAQLNLEFVRSWYFITDARIIFESKLGKQDGELYFNLYNLDALGYNCTSEAIYLNKYRSLRSCIEGEIRNCDFFKIESSIQNIKYIQPIVNIYKRDLEIVPISSDEYISINKLKSIGITKQMLDSYASDFLATQNKGNYFTLQFIRNTKYLHELEELGFEDIFYCALLESNPDIQYSTLINTPIFTYDDKYNKDAALESLVSYVLGDEDSMDEYELSQKIYDIFGIDLENELRASNSFYYNHKSMKIYRDKECFYEELRNHDQY